MFKLELYKDRPLIVTGRTIDELLSNLRHWLILRENYVSGLACDYAVLKYDKRRKKWCIFWLDIGKPGYFEWGRAVKAFVDACFHQVTEYSNSPGHG